MTGDNVTAGLDTRTLHDSGIEWDGSVVTRQGEPVYTGVGVRSVHTFVTLNEVRLLIIIIYIILIY